MNCAIVVVDLAGKSWSFGAND